MTLFRIKNVLTATLATLSLLVSAAAFSATAVVVHPSNGNDLTPEQIAQIFLGKRKSFPDGNEAIPIDQAEGSDVRSAFVSNVLKRNEQQVKAYWAQLLFTGKGTPPKEVSSPAEVKKLVAQNPSLIGYMDEAEVDSSVKVIHTF